MEIAKNKLKPKLIGLILCAILLVPIAFSIRAKMIELDPMTILKEMGMGPRVLEVSESRVMALDTKKNVNVTYNFLANRSYIEEDGELFATFSVNGVMNFNESLEIPMTLSNSTDAIGVLTHMNLSATLKMPILRFVGILKPSSEVKTQGAVTVYDWHNVSYLAAPGNGSEPVKYDHLNNRWNTPTEPGYYEGQYWLDFTIPDDNYPVDTDLKGHIHHSVSAMDDAIHHANYLKWGGPLGTILLGALGLAGLLTPFVAAFIGLMAGIVALMGFILEAFFVNVVLAAMSDGFSWLWNYGWSQFLYIKHLWWEASFGAWRDLIWLFNVWILWDSIIIVVPPIPTNPIGGGSCGSRPLELVM